MLGTLFIGFRANAYTLPSLKKLFTNQEISVLITPLPTPLPNPVPTWTMTQKILEAKELLKNIQTTLKVGAQSISYSESRFTSVNGKIMPTLRNFKEPEKEIGLAVLNFTTGDIKIIIITKRGADLIAPASWNIDILQRPNGIRWNGRNTAYRINLPVQYVVIANVYPNEKDTTVAQKKNGKTIYITKRVITYNLYAPYSPDLHTSELVKSGQEYTSAVITKAFADLRSAGVKSRSVPIALVADVFASRSYFFSRIPLLEQTDLTEFEIDPQNTIERAQVIIGANQDQAFNTTCNSSSACGWVQFTPGTYATIVKDYPSAKLVKDFKSGAADHVNSMKAAILLYDENLKGLINLNGSKVLNDPRLEEYLASSYNGAPRHVYTTLKAAILGGLEDWISALTPKTGGLKDETKGYLVKLRYLQQHEVPAVAISNPS